MTDADVIDLAAWKRRRAQRAAVRAAHPSASHTLVSVVPGGVGHVIGHHLTVPPDVARAFWFPRRGPFPLIVTLCGYHAPADETEPAAHRPCLRCTAALRADTPATGNT